MSKLIRRDQKKAFWGIPSETGTTTFQRMKYFTDMSGSKNPSEYSRRYVDEKSDRTDVTAYSESWSFGFDEYVGDDVLTDVVGIIDNNKLGTDAHREIVFVNFSKESGSGYIACKQSFAVIADSEGGSNDAYTYGGNLKAVGEKVWGVATIATPSEGDPENVETITFEENVSE